VNTAVAQILEVEEEKKEVRMSACPVDAGFAHMRVLCYISKTLPFAGLADRLHSLSSPPTLSFYLCFSMFLFLFLLQGVVSGETMAVGMARLGQPTQQVAI